jgi:NADH:ubiquinone oxidoreductase subunit 5 (subunit L)/multisubunit Na+/H+ antiporter MnhA subunit
VAHATGTRNLEELGGLLKPGRMPTTGATFLVGSAAITGLPPLNGFVSELLIYLAAFTAIGQKQLASIWPVGGLLAIASLAIIGGLALACFAKVFGIVFLGEPRTGRAAGAHEVGPSMRVPMVVLAGLCFAIALFSPMILNAMAPAVMSLVPLASRPDAESALIAASQTLFHVAGVTIALMLLVGLIAMLRRRLLARRTVERAGTWDCGYAAPSPRMQYSASSFADPILRLFAPLLRTRRQEHKPAGPFPADASLHTDTPDLMRDGFYRPVFLAVGWLAFKLRWLQQGRIQLYVLYIALTVLVLMVLTLG